MTFLGRHKTILLVSSIIVFGAFLRFYKLDWANGLFTHPDEYHIVASVNQLSFPNQMHPHFFSYGTVTIYLIYFTKEFLTFFNSHYSSFLIGRFYSALFSTLTIFIVYKISRTFLRKEFSFLAAFLTAITPGLIQQAHFATPESVQTFFLFLSLLFLIKFLKDRKIFYLILASIFLGFALGVKISSIVFLLPLLLSIILSSYFKRHSGLSRISNHLGDSGCAAAYQNDAEGFRSFRKLFRLMMLTLFTFIITITTFRLVAPYVFLDYNAFRSNLDYEGGLAVGKIPVFYTRQFINTTPILFQVEKILPYALGPALLVFSVAGFTYLILSIIIFYSSSDQSADGESRSLSNETMKQFNNDNSRLARTISMKTPSILVIIAFLSLFLPNGFLFAKWTRFIAPTFPFFPIFAVFLLEKVKKIRNVFYFLSISLIIATLIWTIAFFSIYTNHDVRLTVSEWIISHVKPGSSFLVEGGNTVDLPLQGNFQRTSIDFYNLENDPLVRERIVDALYTSNYFLVQSRRVFYNHQRLPNLYPKTARFYDALFKGDLGFEQVKTFHSYPKLGVSGWKLEVPDEAAEETWSVFDHPVIRIFEKKVQLTKERYSEFFGI